MSTDENDLQIDEDDRTKITTPEELEAGDDFDVTAIATLAPKAKKLLDNVNSTLIGQPEAVRLSIICLLSGGHALIEDVPGVGKTLLAKSLALSVHAKFKRIQCTPDLLPSDVCGVSIFDSKENVFKFVPGPIFTNILLADEINRATPRTQSALLEAMEEHQVTTDGATRKLPELFFVIATENPIEYHGTFPLPEAQLDRFMISLSLGYPKPHQEVEILDKTLEEGSFEVDAVLTEEEVLEARQAVRQVFVDPSIKNYIVSIVNATRKHPSIVLGVSPRGSQLLMRAAQAAAFVDGRDFVKPDDVKLLAPYVLGHRVIPKVRESRVSHAELIERVLEEVPVPV
ncbi:MAG: MoxR family ATPase [Candidatus Melainabacteria bacterium]|nr:MoxR family ATPase [Candidatus Melainabacteria bacterium]